MADVTVGFDLASGAGRFGLNAARSDFVAKVSLQAWLGDNPQIGRYVGPHMPDIWNKQARSGQLGRQIAERQQVLADGAWPADDHLGRNRAVAELHAMRFFQQALKPV